MMGTNLERVVPDRVNVDIEGLRDRIIAAYGNNPLWDKLSLSQKLRTLIEERLEQLEEGTPDRSEPQ